MNLDSLTGESDLALMVTGTSPQLDPDDNDDGSISSSSSDSSDEGEGSDEDAEGSGAEGSEGSDEESVKEESHPLMRPGAVPRISSRLPIVVPRNP